MNTLGILIVSGLVLLGLLNFVTNQICNEGSYTSINDPRRSVQAGYDDAVDTPICDEGINEDTWFRFSSSTGDTIVERAANNPVLMQRCGTEAPIYIRGLGSHPVTDFTSTNATVCANYGGNPCNWMETILIHRCLGYYLYKLKSPPGCSISYCVEAIIVCNRGDYWNGTFCVNYFPAMKGLPILCGPLVSGSQQSAKIYFHCHIQYVRQPNDSNARFRVKFLFDGLPLEYIGVKASRPPERLEPIILNPDSSLVAVLNETYLRGRLGKEISCQAESFWDGHNKTSSIMTSAGKYYAAFESTVHSYDINLTNGSTHSVTFKSTLPFTCRHCVNATALRCCQYRFRMERHNASSTQCAIVWKGNDTAVVTVYFVPGATQMKNSFALVFDPYNDDELSGGRSLWRDYVIPPVTMTIVPQSEPYKACHSSTDPHLTTFDGVYFDNLRVGDFYLVKAKNDKQLMEIQVRHEICYGQASCNCGVIVREGNSAFKISICETGSWGYTQRSPTVVRLLSQDPGDSSTVYIDGTGLKFSVRMPSGLRVEVDAKKPWFNVYVHLPPEYHGKTDSASMCGNSNGHSNDDFTTNLEQFRIPDDLSYFRRQPACFSKYNVAATRCDCNVTNPKCSNNDPTLKAVSTPDKPYSGRLTTGVVCNRTNQRRRRDTEASSQYESSNSENDFILDDNILFPPYTYDPNFGVNVSFTWPTPKGKTEQEVEQYCANMLESSPAYADCSANADLKTIIAMCKSDIQIADDWISVSAYANVFEQDCLNNIAASINSSDSNSSVSAFEALTSVSGKLCPNNCSGNGTCSEGTCTCNTGYIGADCSIDQTLPPSLTDIIRHGACDVHTRPCDVISVFGSGVAFSSALKCRFTDQNTGAHVETNGTFITAGEYSCPVPATTTHRRRRSVTTRTTALSAKYVSITVDGVLYSNELGFVLFNSICMECNGSDTCKQTDNSCLFSGECFADKAVNPDDPCLQCVPSVSRNSWTNVTVVENWSPCTRNCDDGVETKNTVCSYRITKKEVQFCKVRDCPGNAEQKTQGVGITLSSESLKQILTEPDKIVNPIADALNSYCSTNAVKCCHSVGVFSTSVTSVTYTSANLTTYAAGYPMLTTSDAQVKIIVKIDENRLRADCAGTEPVSSSIVYADTKLIYDAVSGAKTDIEKELGVTIKSVWSPEPVTSKPVTPELLTLEPVTLERNTLEPDTPEIVTQEPLTPKPVVPEPITSKPATPEHVTTKPVTSEPFNPESAIPELGITKPVTPKTDTLEPITMNPVTSEPVTPEPLTLEPVTLERDTLEPDTPESVTQEPLTPKPVVPEPVTSDPATPEHVTTKPVTSEPFTPESAIHEPGITKPVTPKTDTPESITMDLATSEPVTLEFFTPETVINTVFVYSQELGVTIKSVWSPESVTSEPLTLLPVTLEPDTPEPDTTESFTQGPLTPKPVVPEPVTSESSTPEPVTTKPVTSELFTPEPFAPKPVTLETVTPEPVTPKPVAPKPVTPEPITPEHEPDTSTASATCYLLFPIGLLGTCLLFL